MPRELPPELDLSLVLHLAAAAVWPSIQREFEVEGVNPGYWGVLMHIGSRGRMTPSELATDMGLRATTVRDQVQALADRGSVRRVDNPLDARSYFVTLTAQGTREVERGVAASARALDAVEKEYGPLDALRTELLRFIEAADRVVAEGRDAERAREIDAALRQP